MRLPFRGTCTETLVGHTDTQNRLVREEKKMKIESNELRRRINKLFSEMGWISKEEVMKIIDELEWDS